MKAAFALIAGPGAAKIILQALVERDRPVDAFDNMPQRQCLRRDGKRISARRSLLCRNDSGL